jgi:hypothetical protein
MWEWVQTHVFLTSALDGGVWSRPGRFTSTERDPSPCRIEEWVGSTGSLYDMERQEFLMLMRIEPRSRGRLVCNQWPENIYCRSDFELLDNV